MNPRVGVRYEDDVREVPRVLAYLLLLLRGSTREDVQVRHVSIEFFIVEAFFFAEDVVEDSGLLGGTNLFLVFRGFLLGL